MTSARLVDAARRARRAWSRSVRELTPGQRWTTGLMVGLALLVLGFGLPGATRTVFPAAASEAAGAATERSDVPAPEAPPSFSDTLVRPVGTRSRDVAPTTIDDGDGVVREPLGPTHASIVALYDPAAGVGDRTDEAMARRYLAIAAVRAAFVPIDDIEAACAAVKGATLALAGGPLPDAIRQCLRLGGIYSLSFDDDVELGPVQHAVSTRRGAARSLLDTAALAAGSLTGQLGLVADERLRLTIEPVLDTARAAGLDLASVIWLEPGEPPASVALSLAAAGLSGVLFATSTENQSTIGSQLRTVAPSTRLVVLDAADSITSASYLPLFDGAIAVTSIQLSWHPGAEEQRLACRSAWESAQTPPSVVSDGELLRALSWCQHAAMAAVAAERAASLGLRAAVLGMEVTSPITSPFGPLADGGIGPATVTQVTWAAACACWSSTAPFEPSGSMHG